MLFIGINNEVQNMQHIQIKFNQVHRFKFCTKIHMTEVIIEGGGERLIMGSGAQNTHTGTLLFSSFWIGQFTDKSLERRE